MSKRKRMHVYYSGRVQGVGFRYSVRETACGFDASGFVCNLPDGRVELIAEADEEELKSFLEAIDTSHLGGYIRSKDVTWSDALKEFKGFEIRF